MKNFSLLSFLYSFGGSLKGRRRNPADWTYDNVPQPQYINRGYTMHEMLDEFGLINMNGRCYDPVVGRFLSPDIIVQNPNNTQCFNRYSYCVNNPLKYSDPSGWVYDQSWTHRHNANVVNHNFLDRLWGHSWKFSEEKEWFALIEATGGNSLNNAGEPVDLLGIYANNVKMDNSLNIWGSRINVRNHSNGDPKFDGKEFDNLQDMVIFMYVNSNMESKDGVEISGYILKDKDGSISYWINPWAGNTRNTSNNDYDFKYGDIADVRDREITYNGKNILYQIHTHPYYTDYEGPSDRDIHFSENFNIDMIVIGRNEISYISSTYIGVNAIKFYETMRNGINQFYFTNTKAFLKGQYYPGKLY